MFGHRMEKPNITSLVMLWGIKINYLRKVVGIGEINQNSETL